MDAQVAQLKEKVGLLVRVDVVDRALPEAPPAKWLPLRSVTVASPRSRCSGASTAIHVTGLLHDEHVFPTEDSEVVACCWQHMNSKIDADLDAILQWDECSFDDAEVARARLWRHARAVAHAVTLAREQGAKAGLFSRSTLWSVPEAAVRALPARASASSSLK